MTPEEQLQWERVFKVEAEARNSEWEKEFLKLFPKTRVHLIKDQPQIGPDNWPYLLVETDQDKVESAEPTGRVLNWLATRGIGLVLNPQQAYPDYIFTYGMIWNYRETGEFLSTAPVNPAKSGSMEIQPGKQLWVGQPTVQYLPEYVRKILKQFWMDQGVLSPKIAMVSVDQKNYDLAFSLESLGNPPQEEWQGVMEAISWFLPSHYVVALLSEKSVQGFEPL